MCLMNSFGWVGGGFAPIAIGLGAAQFGMGLSLGRQGAIYLTLGLILRFAIRHPRTAL
jgi:hypothetical protein